jgi:hypothetical protein
MNMDILDPKTGDLQMDPKILIGNFHQNGSNDPVYTS